MDLPSIDDELAALRAQVAALTARLADIEANGVRKRIPPPPVSERPVTISHPTRPVAVDMPNDEVLAALWAICAREFPAWTDSSGYVWAGRGKVTKEQNDEAWLSMFSSSLLAISNMRRLDQPDKRWPPLTMLT